MKTSYLFKIKNYLDIEWYVSANSYSEAEKKYIEYHSVKTSNPIKKIKLMDKELIL